MVRTLHLAPRRPQAWEEIHYLTINPGGSEQILFVYAVDADGAKANEAIVVSALRSLKKS